MRKRIIRAWLLFIVFVWQGVSYADVQFGNITVMGGVATVIQTNIEDLVINNPKMQLLSTESISNEDSLQFIYGGKYIAYNKEQISQTTAGSALLDQSRADLSLLRRWDSANGYQYVLLGRYRQDYDSQPIVWRVLDVKDGKALLLSELILDTKPFDSSTNEWEDSDLKYWLNSDFYTQAFSNGEKSAILRSSSIGTVFLLSRGELSNPSYGFKKNIYEPDPNRSAAGSMHAYSNNLWVVQMSEYTNYYARSKANYKSVDLVASNGKFVLARIDRDNVGVRPAVWVDINKLSFSHGEGTIGYPFQ